jgi:hypothetical protein
MEPLRPVMDRAVLGVLLRERLHPADFPLQADGACRLHPALARQVATLAWVDPTAVVSALTARLTATVVEADA